MKIHHVKLLKNVPNGMEAIQVEEEDGKVFLITSEGLERLLIKSGQFKKDER